MMNLLHSENAKLNKKTTAAFTRIRTALGHAQEIAEELIPMNALAGFYKQHADHARLVKVYPDAEVVRDALPWSLVSAYCDTFEGEELPATCYESLRDKARTHYARACAVATGVKRIAWPVACAEACHVAAYATLKCEQLYLEQSWHRSMLTSVQSSSSTSQRCSAAFVSRSPCH